MTKVEQWAKPKQITKINEVLELNNEIRADRVAELKKLVQAGRYKIDSEAVSDKMVNQLIIELIK